MKYWIILAAIVAFVILARLIVKGYRISRAIQRIDFVRKPFPEPDDYLDDVFGKGKRP